MLETYYLLPLVVLPVVFIINVRRKRPVLKLIFQLITSLYICMVLSITLSPILLDLHTINYMREAGYGPSFNMVPFRSIEWDPQDYFVYRNVIGNLLLLFPFGMVIRLKFKGKIVRGLFIGTLVSIAIETAQYILSTMYIIDRRSIDIDDVILNSFGYLCGYIMILLLDVYLYKRFKNGISIA